MRRPIVVLSTLFALVSAPGCSGSAPVDDTPPPVGQGDGDGDGDGDQDDPGDGDGDGDRGDGDGMDAGEDKLDAGITTGDAGAGQASDHDASQPPSPHAPPTDDALEYFADLDPDLRDQDLVRALHDKLARDHQALTYNELIGAYTKVDAGRDGCANIFDFYSQQCWTVSDSCGQYSGEGDCFNREHAWPKSWWGGSKAGNQHQDLISVIPTDGFVNSVRGELPLGETEAANYTSTNGSKRGPCSVPDAPKGAVCFEPPDALKGDFARIYFYEATRYEGEFSCCDEEAVTKADIKPWQEAMLRKWHEADPVDLAERERNERVYDWQNNRNPFVDLAYLVDRIADF